MNCIIFKIILYSILLSYANVITRIDLHQKRVAKPRAMLACYGNARKLVSFNSVYFSFLDRLSPFDLSAFEKLPV